MSTNFGSEKPDVFVARTIYYVTSEECKIIWYLFDLRELKTKPNNCCSKLVILRCL